MANMDETTKKILLFLGLVVLIGFIVVVSFSLVSSPENILEELNETILKEETLDFLELDAEFALNEDYFSFENGISPDHIQKGSLKIKLNNVYAEESEEGDWDLYFEVLGEDLLVDESESKSTGNFFYRSPLSWSADLMKHRKDLNPLLTCELNSNGRFWNTTYCISMGSLDKGYFGQTVRLVYTDKSLADVEELTLLALTRESRTFVFELEIPKEFYEDKL